MKTVSQAAKDWNVTPACVYLWIARGLIQSINLGERATMVVTDSRPVTPPKGRPKKT